MKDASSVINTMAFKAASSLSKASKSAGKNVIVSVKAVFEKVIKEGGVFKKIGAIAKREIMGLAKTLAGASAGALLAAAGVELPFDAKAVTGIVMELNKASSKLCDEIGGGMLLGPVRAYYTAVKGVKKSQRHEIGMLAAIDVFNGGSVNETADEKEARARAQFEQADDDGSGSIDMDELKTMLVNLGADANSDYIPQIFAECDQGGKGALTFDEFKLVLASVRTSKGAAFAFSKHAMEKGVDFYNTVVAPTLQDIMLSAAIPAEHAEGLLNAGREAMSTMARSIVSELLRAIEAAKTFDTKPMPNTILSGINLSRVLGEGFKVFKKKLLAHIQKELESSEEALSPSEAEKAKKEFIEKVLKGVILEKMKAVCIKLPPALIKNIRACVKLPGIGKSSFMAVRCLANITFQLVNGAPMEPMPEGDLMDDDEGNGEEEEKEEEEKEKGAAEEDAAFDAPPTAEELAAAQKASKGAAAANAEQAAEKAKEAATRQALEDEKAADAAANSALSEDAAALPRSTVESDKAEDLRTPE